MPPKSTGQNQSQQIQQQGNNVPLHELIAAINPNNIENKLQAHNLTISQMRDLRDTQAIQDEELMEANCNPKYKIKKSEQHLIHLLSERKRFDSESGDKLSKPQMKKLYVEDFEKMSQVIKDPAIKNHLPENAFAKQTVTMIHDPRKNVVSKAATSAQQKIDADALTGMDIDQLRATYKTVTDEVADIDDSADMLVIMIKEALAKTK